MNDDRHIFPPKTHVVKLWPREIW